MSAQRGALLTAVKLTGVRGVEDRNDSPRSLVVHSLFWLVETTTVSRARCRNQQRPSPLPTPHTR